MIFDTLMQYEQMANGRKYTNYYLMLDGVAFKVANNGAISMIQQISLERGQWMADASGGRKRFYRMK